MDLQRAGKPERSGRRMTERKRADSAKWVPVLAVVRDPLRVGLGGKPDSGVVNTLKIQESTCYKVSQALNKDAGTGNLEYIVPLSNSHIMNSKHQSSVKTLGGGQKPEFPPEAKSIAYARQLDSQDKLGNLRDQFNIPTRSSLRKKALSGSGPGALSPFPFSEGRVLICSRGDYATESSQW